MQYRNDKYGNPISVLGYGCMRFTKKGTSFDADKAEKELMLAYEKGVNYYDSAYIYGGSEALIGQIFEKNEIRSRINIATKLPQYMIKNTDHAEKIFNEELKRLRTDHVDYYLMHMITDYAQWERLVNMGMTEWIEQKKKNGQIRNIGFSFHGNSEYFLKVLDAYDWEFCQVQYNYMDEYSQAGRMGVEAAQQKDIPVIIMEPLKGGRLVNNLPSKVKEMIRKECPDRTPAEISLRWLWDQPGVTCVLSGMNSAEMVEENCRIAAVSEPGCVTAKEREAVEKIKSIMSETIRVGCTGCRYCMPCPQGVDIPAIFNYYNQMYTDSKYSGWKEYFQTNAFREKPAYATLCVGCGKCEKHCPQSIPIREKLKEADKALRPWPIKIAGAVGRKFMVRKDKSKQV